MNFWTSDPHYWHNNVITYCKRPYTSIEEMNEALVENFNKIVGRDDHTFIVGDFSLAFRAVETYVNRLNGTKSLVAGNHDFCHPAHKKSRTPENRQKWTDKYLECGFDEVYIEHKFVLKNGVYVRMCHLPYRDASEEQNHAKHRPEDDGTILLCGHVHEKWKVRYTEAGTAMVNVGVDVWDYKPVSEDELCELFLVTNGDLMDTFTYKDLKS